MKLIRPIEITDAVLGYTNVPEDEDQWLVGTTYDAGDIVRGTGDYEHQLFLSANDSNTGHAVTDPEWWTPFAATNAWGMFDDSVGRQTVNPDSIVVEFDVPGRVDTIGLLNVDAQEIRIIATDETDGVVYDETYAMVSNSGILNLWDYFNEPIVRLRDLIVTNIPALYANLTITLEILNPGGDAKCGECVIGRSFYIGGTRWGGQGGIQDYSTKEPDIFGGFSVVERAFSKIWDFEVLVEPALFDTVYNMLASYRATPILYVGDEVFTSTVVYGYFREFRQVLAGPTQTLCNLDLVGLA